MRFRENMSRLLADGILKASGLGVDPGRIRLPARTADAAVPMVGVTSDVKALAVLLNEAPDRYFEAYFGICPVERVWEQNGWLYFSFSNAFLSRAIDTAVRLQVTSDPLTGHTVNAMLVLSRHGGSGCPECAPIHDAAVSLLCLLPEADPARIKAAEQRLEGLFSGMPFQQSMLVRSQCGAFGRAAANILSLSVQPARQERK